MATGPADSDVVYIPEEGDHPPHDQQREKNFLYHAHTAYVGSCGDEVSFDRGARLEVLNKSVSGWWTVRYVCVCVMY